MGERTTEEYLETIGALEESESPVRTSALAGALGLSMGSVSEMLKRLAKKGLVNHAPYEGVSLSGEGKKGFLRLTRRHRLWEVFLNNHLGIAWEDIYPEACSLEHCTSELVAESLAHFLNDPEYCPHGSPIPHSNYELPQVRGIPLPQLEVGRTGKMVAVECESDAQYLRYLRDIGLAPGEEVKVLERSSLDGTLIIEVNGSSKAMGTQVASLIIVEPA